MLGIPSPGLEKVTVIGPATEAQVLINLKADADLYWFRGQPGRHDRVWPPESRKDIDADAYTMESIVPSEYRGLEHEIRSGNKAALKFNPEYNTGFVVAKYVAAEIIVDELAKTKPSVAQYLNYLNTLRIRDRADQLLSLAQHAGVKTAYTDLSHNPKVALHFACVEFNGNTPNGTGYIYRIRKEALKNALTTLQLNTGIPRGVVELNQVPSDLTPRPTNQQGVTAFGLEVGEVLLNLIANDAIQRFDVIRDGSGTYPNQSFIYPTNDPMHQEFRCLQQGKNVNLWISTMQYWAQHTTNPNPLPDLNDSAVRKAILRV